MNQAETAFAWPEGDHWRLRWFTPELEVDLCGHATLATAKVLWTSGRATGPIQFETRSGTLTCTAQEDSIQMDFPAEVVEEAEIPSSVDGFGDIVWAGRNRMDWFIEVADTEVLTTAQPNLEQLRALPCRGLIVTAQGTHTDFISRFFAPQSGVPEDPVTGSAHCALAPYWASRLHKTDLVGYQASRRGGYVKVSVRGDRVILGGQARIVVEGQWLG
jgi:predicted PhzF superfamily epimerase YddE/YHI9